MALEPARLEAQLKAQATAAQHDHEDYLKRTEAREIDGRCLQHELHQSAAAGHRAHCDPALSQSSLRDTQLALLRESSIIQFPEKKMQAEQQAAAVRAAAKRIRAAMQVAACEAVSSHADDLAAQNECLLADRKALMRRLAMLEQQRDGLQS